jgi:hypothetical protein
MAEAKSLLIDTSYLLPLFGFESTFPTYDEIFPDLLKEYDVKYNPISLIEAKWLVIRTARKAKGGLLETFLRYYREGIAALGKEDRIHESAFTNENVEELSDRLFIEADLRDYFDRQIYSTAACLNFILLTEDQSLHALARSQITPKPKAVMWWSDTRRAR